MINFEDVVASLGSLNAKQLQELRARCAVLLQGKGASSDGPTVGSDVELVLLSIIEFMRHKGTDFSSFAQLKGSKGYSSFAKGVPGTMSYLREITTNKVELGTLLKMGIGWVHDDLKRWTIADSRNIMRRAYTIPSMFEMNFPGYRRAGLLGLVLLGNHKTGQELANVRKK